MNMTEMNEQVRLLGAKVVAEANALTAMANGDATLEQIKAQTVKLDDAKARLAAAQAAMAAMSPESKPAQMTEEDKSVKDILKSREYARAWALALKTGAKADKPMQDERLKILYDTMTIGGGNPAGTDGGFLVPEDINHNVIEKVREIAPLINLFGYETVSSNSGWRVTDAAVTTGFSSINEAATVPTDQQPAFSKVSFSLTKYGLRIPISRELADDEVGNLFGYLSGWLAKKMAITTNGLLLGTFSTLTPVAISANTELRGIKEVLNTMLDPAISATSSMLINQTGFDLLDSIVDQTGRPLLQWDPTNGTPRMLNGKTVHVISNTFLPNHVPTGETNPDTAPLYIGNFAEYATLFQRMPLEIDSTDIGGTAWTNASIEVRALTRMGVAKFDTAAVKACTLAL